MKIDPWKHRSSEMKCATCMWFVIKEVPAEPVEGDVQPCQPTLGRCRRHAPTLSGYPAVFVGDWCGDHKLNEEAL